MRITLPIGAAALLSGCGAQGVYPMAAEAVYATLSTAEVPGADRAPMGGLRGASVAALGNNQIRWTGNASRAADNCTLTITPVDAAKSRLQMRCGDVASDRDAITPLENKQTRNGMIEFVDAKLAGRPYDTKRAVGSTAANWPAIDDVQETPEQTAVREAAVTASTARAAVEDKPKPEGW